MNEHFDDDDMDIVDNEGKGTGKRRGTPLVLVILIAFLSGAAGGILSVKILFPGGEPVKTKPGEIVKPVDPDNPDPGPAPVTPEVRKNYGLLEFEPFTTVLGKDPFGVRYIEAVFQFVISKKELAEEIKNNKRLIARLRSDIFMILGGKSLRDVKGVSGRIALLEEIKMRANEIIKEELDVEPIIEVLHTVWKVQ